MGASSSKDLTSMPGQIGESGRGMSDTFLALTKVLCDLGVCLDKNLSVHFNDEEAREYYNLNLQKTQLVSEIEAWARKQQVKYQVTLDQINRLEDQEEKVKAAMRLFEDDTVDGHLEGVVKKINALKTEFELFGNRLRKKYGEKETAKLVAGVFGIVGCLALAGWILLHFIPGINVVIAPAYYAYVALAGAGFATTAAVALSKDEVQRAIAYLNDVEKRLKDLRTAVQELKAEHTRGKLEQDFPDKCATILVVLIKHCDRLIKVAKVA